MTLKMEVYINANDSNIVIEGVKDPIIKTKLLNLTEAYLSGLYDELGLSKTGEVMNLRLSSAVIVEPKNENCCICMVDCSNSKNKVVVPDCGCLHKYYHEECLKKWFRVKRVCPTCNRRCNGKGYRRYKWENPYNSKSQSGKGWLCCGGTHPKRSTFKSLSSALKHANTKHNINLVNRKRDGLEVWICNVGECVRSTIRTDEEALHHLISEHHIDVITEK